MMTKRTPRVLTIVLLACLFSSAAGFAQTVSLTQLDLTFAPQVVSTTSSAKPVTLKNTSGTATLTIASISSSGDYSITTSPNPCTSIAPLGTCTLNISFAPNAVGVIDGAVTIVDNASTSPQVVTLAGTAIPPISLAPTSLSFGTVAVGSSSAPKTVKVTNNTAAAVTVSSPTISGEYKFPPASGSIVQTCTGVPLPAGGSCTATIEFQPTITGKIPGALTVSHTASGTPQVVALTGTGSGTVTSTITFTPTSLNFGNVLTGTTTLVKTVTLKNVSSNAITVNSVSGSGNYNATTTCGVVQPAGTCPMNVTFSPSNLGSIGGAASVTETDNVTHAQNVPVFGMTGTGVGQLSFNPAALNFFIQDLNVPGTSQNT